MGGLHRTCLASIIIYFLACWKYGADRLAESRYSLVLPLVMLPIILFVSYKYVMGSVISDYMVRIPYPMSVILYVYMFSAGLSYALFTWHYMCREKLDVYDSEEQSSSQ